MISEQAQNSFHHLFKAAVMANFSVSNDDSCDIEPINGHEEITEAEFSVLTITSSSFRFLTLLHFESNEATINYFAKSSIALNENNDSSVFLDAILEFCNMACGSMNRTLHNHYHFLGMSTPYVLTRPSLDFISILDPGYVKHYRITINRYIVLHATLCICNYGTVDFTVDTTETEDSTGELEMF